MAMEFWKDRIITIKGLLEQANLIMRDLRGLMSFNMLENFGTEKETEEVLLKWALGRFIKAFFKREE